MARLLGVDIPNRKKIEYSLRYIYGIGPTRAKKILEETGIDPNRRTQDLDEQELSLITNYIIDQKIMVEGDLRRAVTNNPAFAKYSLLGVSVSVFAARATNHYQCMNPKVDDSRRRP